MIYSDIVTQCVWLKYARLAFGNDMRCNNHYRLPGGGCSVSQLE